MLKRVFLFCLAATCFMVSFACADNRQLSIDLVEKAIAFADEKGVDAAFAEMNKADGMFTAPGGLYVFAYDLEGAIVAHYNDKILGKNLLNKPDAKGFLFRVVILDLAKSKGEGWVDYTYMDKDTKAISEKTTYLKKYKNYIFCCGYTK